MSRARVRLVARFGLAGSPLRPFVIGSFAVHVLAAVAILLWPTSGRSMRIPENALIVELAAPSPSLSRAPAVAPAAAPAPGEPPDGVRVQTKPVKIDESPRKPPSKPPVEPQPEVAPVRTPDPAPGAPPAGRGSPAAGAAIDAGPPSAGGSIQPMEGGDAEFAWYRASVTAALYSYWRRPVLSEIRVAVEVGVAFEIQRDGTVRNLRIEQRSGIPSLDRSALRAVTEASPLPPLPPGWREPSLQAGFVFRLFPEDL